MNAHSKTAASDVDALVRIPPVVCWTRMQAEAGQDLTQIIERKEHERQLQGGVFFWGVGNPPPLAIQVYARRGASLPLLFSIMKSKPKAHDSAPDKVRVWRQFVDSDGAIRPLPLATLVTSRATARTCHYALVCRSDGPLRLSDLGPFDPSAYRNLGGTGAPIGYSQVTALVQRHRAESGGEYRVAMSAILHGGLWIKLVDPVDISIADRRDIDTVSSTRSWQAMVTRIRSSQPLIKVRDAIQNALPFA